ncbi:glycosyltransferase family 2 protein [Yoonia sp.]|uniref:glycosyltransferase family 2 protein n=1 Tax=Yoonia sp. TaxID=2212373 RepID=UPI002FD94510
MRNLIITSMRNEAPFVLEWIAYHQHIGFTDFLIYTNDCDDGTDLLLDRLAELGHVVHLRSHSGGKKPVQWRALNKARRHPLTRSADWIFVADVDEFLNIHVGQGLLADLLGARPEAAGFAIPWRMFGNAGVRRFEDRPVITQFTQAAPEAMIWPWRAVQYKSLFKADGEDVDLGVHRPKSGTADRWCDGNGQPDRAARATYQFQRGARYGLAQINHYALGSIESFLVKRDRGKPNHHTDPIDLAYWVERNFAAAEDRSILRHAAAVSRRVDAFHKDPTLAGLHAEGVAWRQGRIAALLADPEVFNLYTTLLQVAPTCPLPLGDQEQLFNQLVRLRRALRSKTKP